MTKTKRGIFIDLDGTLLNNEGEISPYTLKVLKEYKDIYNIYLITGMSYEKSIKYYREIGLNTYLISSSGQRIHKNEVIEYSNLLERNEINKTIKLIEDEIEIKNYLVEGTGNKFFTEKTNIHEAVLDMTSGSMKDQVDSLEDINECLGLYILTTITSSNKIHEIKKYFNTKFKSKYQFRYWRAKESAYVLYVTRSKSSKWNAIKIIKKIDKLNKVISFGNGNNDKEMIINSDIGIAMKNSAVKLKNVADRITEFSNDENGVAKCIKNFQ